MASASLDDFVLNFDLNQLTNEVNVQTVEQKYEKLRKTTTWLKSKIISTDLAILKYQAKKDDCDQAVKAYSVSKEELKQACINYKNVSDKCAILENENKLLITNQEVLKERLLDSENKYSAILSHSNQLQVLLKDLETENNAIKVEKELDNCSNKERNEAIMLLRKEKESIINDIVALKDVILGQQKTNKSHVKLLKKYVKDIKWKASNTRRSEENDDMETYDHFSSHNSKGLKKINKHVDTEFVSSAEQNFIDNCSDSSNGQVSVDTGRGSSRANSHDKYQSSPDYMFTPLPFKTGNNLIHVASSPILIYPPRSVATSPIIFDPAPTLVDDQYDDYLDCFDGPENDNFDDTPLSDGRLDLKEQVKIINICISPVTDLPKLTNRPIKNNEHIIFKELADKSPKRSLFIEPDETEIANEESQILEKESLRCFCQKVKDKNIFVDACTSPLPELRNHREFIDTGTCTVNDGDCGNFNDNSEIKDQRPKFCEKATWTEINTLPNKTFIDVCTSPIPKIPACKCGVSTITLKEHEFDKDSSRNCEKSVFNDSITQTKKKLSNTTVGVISKEQNVKLVRNSLFTDESNESNDRLEKSSMTVCNTTSHHTEGLRNQERNCLESNSSPNLYFENSTDSEVQHILKVMKLHHDVISPISTTPSDSQYLRLLPEMKLTLNKIWASLANISKNNGINLNLSHPTEIDEVEIPEGDAEEDVTVGRTNETNQIAGCIFEDNTYFPSAHDIIEEDSNILNLNKTNSNISSTTPLLPINKRNDVIHISEADITHSQQEKNTDTINYICPKDVAITNKTRNMEISNSTEVNKEDRSAKGSQKTKSKSKLEKLRKKLTPTCKIKKMDPPVRPNMAHKFKRKDNSSATLNQKLAYEKAVKIMSELRENKKLEREVKISSSVCKDTKLGSRLGEIESRTKESVGIKTSNAKKINNGEENCMVTSGKSGDDCNVSDLLEQIDKYNKSPTNRRLRKRPADTEIDTFISKRVLRSSTVSQASNENSLHLSPYNKTEKLLHLCNKPRGKNSGRNERVQSFSSPMNSPKSDNVELERHNESKINSLKAAQYDNVELYKSYATLEKDTTMMKPVIDLSMCLTDNINTVSITPGNADFANVNQNIDLLKTSTAGFNSQVLDSQNNKNSIMIQNDTDKGHNSVMRVVPANTDIQNNDLENQVKSNIQNQDKVSNVTQTENGSGKSKNGSVAKDIDINKALMESNKNSYTEKNSDSLNKSSLSINNNNKMDVLHNNLTCTKQRKFESLDIQIAERRRETMKNPVVELIPLSKNIISNAVNNIVNYSDLDLFAMETDLEKKKKNKQNTPVDGPQQRQSILCEALDRYGVNKVKFTAKKAPDTITNNISQKIEDSIANIISSSKAEQRPKMDILVSYIQNYKQKYILSGLIKYLKDPTRKTELFNKITNGSAPPMTKPEMILLYVIEKLNAISPDFINKVWNNIEHALLQLNRTPEFNVIESMSHFYAVLCRYFRNKSRLRCFMLDAMYCLQFKAVPLIRQCLDVCPGVLPYAHERLAKTSLVTCLVYLLHFYKCHDKFNRAQDIRNILYRKYSYKFSEWNETMILEIFRKAIMDLRGTHNDKKMLRVALIILCKRHGPKWCHLNIIQNMLMPIIDKKDVPERIKHFCVLMLGPLLKPFPADRKAQCEIVMNNLLQMLKQDNSQEMNEAIYSSLIFMNKHNEESVVHALVHWSPQNVSRDFKEILNDYVMEKPLLMWRKLLSRKPSQCS